MEEGATERGRPVIETLMATGRDLGITMTPRAVAEIERLRRGHAASDPDQPSTTEEVIAA